MAPQPERDAFLRGWKAAMEEVLAVLEIEAREWAEEEADAATSGGYKLPGSFALEEVRGSFKGRQDLLQWITQAGPAASRANDPSMAGALDALIENRATNAQLGQLGLASQAQSSQPPEGAPEGE